MEFPLVAVLLAVPRTHLGDRISFMVRLVYQHFFLRKNTKLVILVLENLPVLENIDQIINLPNLQFVTINNCPNIKNLKILEQCIGLKKLKVKPPINLNGILLPSVEIVVV